MAIKDVFNNSQNNYIKTGLSPCTSPDVNIFGVVPGEKIGVSNGSEVPQSIYIGDIRVEINSWVQNKKTIGPQEVTFIPGLTKGLNTRSQAFDMKFYPSDSSLLYMGIDVSVNYYSNFKNNLVNISVASDPHVGVNVINSLNLAFDSMSIGVGAAVDASSIVFTGKKEGYNFSVGNPTLKIYDSSMGSVTQSISASEIAERSVPYAKYNNGAFVGMVIKAEYPLSESTYDKWLYVNHVNNEFSYFDDSSTYVTKTVDVGSNVSTSTTIGAPDYLYYITQNGMWDKMGYLNVKVNTFDPDNSSEKNLIPGFYIFNPHNFSVEVDYMLIY